MKDGDFMKNIVRFIWTILSFLIPLIGITLFFTHKSKFEGKLYGVIGVIGIFVYIGIGMGFI